MGGEAAAFHFTGEDYTLLQVFDRSLSNTRYADLADVYEETRFSGLRETARVQQAERNLRDAFRIEPALMIPESDADQDWLREQITAEPHLSWRSLQGWVVDFGKGGTPVDDRLLGLCDLFPNDVASRLSARDSKVAHTLVQAALMQKLPKPGRNAVNRANKVVNLAASVENWTTLAGKLVRARVAKNCQPINDFDTRTLDLNAKERQLATESDEDGGLTAGTTAAKTVAAKRRAITEAARLTAAEGPELARQASLCHRSPLGETEEDIDQFLARTRSSVDPRTLASADRLAVELLLEVGFGLVGAENVRLHVLRVPRPYQRHELVLVARVHDPEPRPTTRDGSLRPDVVRLHVPPEVNVGEADAEPHGLIVFRLLSGFVLSVQ